MVSEAKVLQTELVAYLRARDEIHVVALTERLLQVCRRLMPQLDAAIGHRFNSNLPSNPYLTLVEAIIPDAYGERDPEFVNGGGCARLAALFDAATDDADLVLRVRDAAVTIDIRRGAHFFSRFASQRTDCKPGAAFPAAMADVVVGEMGTRSGLPPDPDLAEAPAGVRTPLDGTKHLRLCPDTQGKLQVVLDTRRAGLIDALFAGDRACRMPGVPGPQVLWGVVVPTCNLLVDLTCDRIDTSDPPAFYRVRPHDHRAKHYGDRLIRGLDIAAGRGASIILAPELACDARLESEVERWFLKTPSVALLLAGSRHLEDKDEPRRNRARVLMRGESGAPFVHDKFSSFSLRLPDETFDRTEQIERPNVLTIASGRRWSFSALICKDFIETTARRLLIDLRVRAVLVASMSPKTGLYETDAAGVAQDGQALVFVGNIPHGPKDATAIFARPRIEPATTCDRQHRDGIVALITTAGESFETVEIEVAQAS